MSSFASAHQKQDDGVVVLNPPNEGESAVVYMKGSGETCTWESKIEVDMYSAASFKIWCNQYQKLKPRMVKMTTPLQWLRNHMHMPDNVSALVRTFLVKQKIPANAIGSDGNDGNKIHREQAQYVVLGGLDGDNSLNSFWTVIDSQNPQRVFIGQRKFVRGTSRAVWGGIWYFNNDGNVEGRPEPFAAALFEYDCRNGSPSPNNVVLCGDSICYVWSHRNDGKIQVKGWILQEDKLKGQYKGLKEWFNLGERETSYTTCVYVKPRVLDQRWLGLASEVVPKWFFIDLKSIRKGPDEEHAGVREATLYDSLTIPTSMDPLAVIKNLRNVPTCDNFMRDSFPMKCVKCSLETVRGRMDVYSEDFGKPQRCFLGQAACEKCRIRYSESEDNWKCWNIVMTEKGLHKCNQVVHGPDYTCKMAEHVSDMSFAVIERREEKRKWHPSAIVVDVKRSKTG